MAGLRTTYAEANVYGTPIQVTDVPDIRFAA